MRRFGKSFLSAALALGALSLGGSAHAIDRYALHRLPHLGFGGEALGLPQGNGTQNGDVPLPIVGRVGTEHGAQQAALWLSDSTGKYALSLLNGVGGPNSRANGILIEFTGAGVVVVGSAQDASGVWKPVMWREKADETGLVALLPTLGGPSGTANACMDEEDFPFNVVGTSQTVDGNSHATLWRINAGGGWDPLDLGTLGGTESEAYALNAHVALLTIVGRAQMLAGDWHACVWTSTDGGQTWTIEDRHPGGVASMLHGTSGDGEKFFSVGMARTSNGRSMGYMDYITNAMPAFMSLTAPGFHNTSAEGICASRYGFLAIGSAWDDPLMPQAVVWYTISSLGQTHAYPASALADHPLMDDVAFRLNAVSSRTMVGAFVDEYVEGGIEPLALVADGTQMPDVVSVPLGQPENHFSETDLWHENDGRTLCIRSQNNRGDRVVVQLSYHEDENADGDFDDRGERRVSVRARVGGSSNATAQIGVQVFNFSSSRWDDVGVPYVLSAKYEDISIQIGLADHADPATGEVRVRLLFSAGTKAVQGYEIDRVSLSRVP